MINHSKAAKQFNLDEERVDWHDKAVWHMRHKRDLGVNKIKNWEALRDTASQIKLNVLTQLDIYLEEFERNAINNGIRVHWAIDGNEHNRIVKTILQEKR